MAIRISGATPGSPAEKLHIAQGSRLLSVNGHAVRDLLDYGLYTMTARLILEIEDASGLTRTVCVRKGEDEELGLESDTFLMDGEQSCRNKCVFCFIDQLPPGLRETLYFKDDDERLSFLLGNFITLTNLTDADCDRIISMKISPVNISVHTTDPTLRCRMMGNRFAGDSLRHLYRLAEAGIAVNCQIVLCPGLNDGNALRDTLRDLSALWPAVQSIAVVPVGLTRYRAGLYPLEPFDSAGAAAVLNLITELQTEYRAQYGIGLVYPADEFFLLAGWPIPKLEYYDELGQLEDGVGMLALFCSEFLDALEEIPSYKQTKRYTIATGELAAPTLRELTALALKQNPALVCEVVAIRNDFFGGGVSVSGLVTAADIAAQLQGRDLGTLLLPSNMLRREGDLFLDSVSPKELAATLNCVIEFPYDGGELARLLMGQKEG